MFEPEPDSKALPYGVAPPDYSYWAKTKFWRVDEAIALMLGASPDDLYSYDAESHLCRTRGSGGDPFARRYLALERLIERHFDHKSAFPEISPSHFFTRLEEIEIDAPRDLVEAVRAHDHSSVDWQARAVKLEAERDLFEKRVLFLEMTLTNGAVSSSAQTRERDSLLKLVVGMAVGGYGYDPTASRSPIAGQIADDLHTCGLAMSEDTVRKYLREGAEHLPGREDDRALSKPNSVSR